MKLQFTVTAKNGTKTIAEVTGREGGIDAKDLTVEDVCERVIETEAFLEKLTGFRWHIGQVG
jgi:hypothetical protein